MGTEINRRGGDTSLPLWSARALSDQPDIVFDIHKDYLTAGAEILTTNTFRTKDYTFRQAGLIPQGEKLTNLAVKLAVQAVREVNSDALVAGSISPVEDCYSPVLVPTDEILIDEHSKMARWLFEGGVNILLIETMNLMREIEIAVNCAKEFNLPIWLSVTCDEFGNILSGEKIESLIDKFESKVDALLINCSKLNASDLAISQLRKTKLPFGIYPNFGVINDTMGWTSKPVTENYLDMVGKWIKMGATIMGTCCGATPNETSAVRRFIDSLDN